MGANEETTEVDTDEGDEVREVLDEAGAGNRYLSSTEHLLAMLIVEVRELRRATERKAER